MSFTKKIKKELILEMCLFCLLIIFAIIFYQNNILLTFLLLVLWGIGMKFWHKREDLAFFFGGAIVPLVGEVACVYFGVWEYANPTLLGIPLWLPLGWGLTAVVIKRIAETFVKIEMK
jgi:hypothetical protein